MFRSKVIKLFRFCQKRNFYGNFRRFWPFLGPLWELIPPRGLMPSPSNFGEVFINTSKSHLKCSWFLRSSWGCATTWERVVTRQICPILGTFSGTIKPGRSNAIIFKLLGLVDKVSYTIHAKFEVPSTFSSRERDFTKPETFWEGKLGCGRGLGRSRNARVTKIGMLFTLTV